MSTRWHQISHGKPAAPALIFLHGFMGNVNDWREVVEVFKDEFRCVAIDLPGHGKTPLSVAGKPLSILGIAEDLADFLAEQHLLHPVLIGYSLGGRIALQIALSHPELLSALVLESASPGIEEQYERTARAALDNERAHQLERIGIKRFFDEWYSQPLFESLQHHPEKLDELKHSRSKESPADLAVILRELSPGSQPSNWQELCKLHLPVMLVNGVFDHKFDHINRRMSEQIPHSVWRTIGDAGHNTHFEHPEAFNSALRTFLHEKVFIAVDKDAKR